MTYISPSTKRNIPKCFQQHTRFLKPQKVNINRISSFGAGGTYTWLSYFKRTIINMKNFHNWRLTMIRESLFPQTSDLLHPPCSSPQISEKEMCADQNLRPTLQYRLFCLGIGREVSGICNRRML